MTEEQQEALEIECTGNIRDGVVSVEAKLGTAKMTLTGGTGDESAMAVQVLLQAFPHVVDQVVENLLEQQQAETGAE